MTDGQLITTSQSTNDETALNSVMSNSAFLPRIQLMTDSSGPVKAEEFPRNHWALIPNSNTYIDLGKELNLIPIACRVKAMRMNDDDSIDTIYDINDPEFKVIQAEANADGMSGSMCGPEFLVWLTEAQKWATFFLVSKSARRQGPAIRDKTNHGITLIPEYISTKRYSWWSFKVEPCNTITPEMLPNIEDIESEIKVFLNPPVQEKVDENTERDR